MRAYVHRSRGFSLLEVLVAFSILAVSLGVLLQVISTSLSNSAEARSFARAAALAESKIEEVGITEPMETGVSAGSFDGMFEWRLEIRPSSAYEEQLTERIGLRLYLVAVDVAWLQGSAEKGLHVETLKLAVAPTAQD